MVTLAKEKSDRHANRKPFAGAGDTTHQPRRCVDTITIAAGVDDVSKKAGNVTDTAGTPTKFAKGSAGGAIGLT